MTASPAGSLQLLVGLGNPGDKYAGTRHNVGFMALERLAAAAGVPFKNQAKLHGLVCEVGQGASRLRLLMPQTFMNDSGRSIRAALDWYGLEPGQLLLLVDDMDLPLGRLRLRASGGAGGHNGLRSTIAHLGGQDFARLRIGIGAPSANPVERKERTEWTRVVIFNEGLAKIAEQYLKKGSTVYIEGQLQTRKWTDKDGVEKYSTEVIVQGFNSSLKMVGGRREGDAGDAGESAEDFKAAARKTFNDPGLADEVPF